MITSKPRAHLLLVVFILGVFAFLTYGRILNAPFVYDDHELLLEHPFLHDIGALIKNWQTDRIKFVTILTFAVNYHFSKLNPFGYHLVNVLIHVVNGLLLFLIIGRLMRTPKAEGLIKPAQRTGVALVATLIFIVHPLQTQAVTYIWQRSEILSAWFYFLAYFFYLVGRLERKKIYYFLIGAVFCIGFFAKGTIASLPVLMITTEIIFFDHIGKRFLQQWSKRPWLVSFFVFLTALIFIQGLKLSSGPDFSISYFWTEILAVVNYISLCLLPIQQNLDYDFPLTVSLVHWPTLCALVVHVAIIAFAVLAVKKNRLLAFGIFWFYIGLVPSSSFVLREPMWEHRVYFSLAGFAFFLTVFLGQVISSTKIRYAALALILLIFSGMTISRNNLWRDPVLLLEDTVKKSPNKVRPVSYLGTLYYTKGRWQDAAGMFERAIKLDPTYAEAYNNLGLIYFNNGRLTKAQGYFEKAVSVRPKFIPGYINLGYFYISQKNFGQAGKIFLDSLNVQKTATAYIGLANLEMARQQWGPAQRYLDTALSIDPDNGKVYFALGQLYQQLNQPEKAQVYFEKSHGLIH